MPLGDRAVIAGIAILFAATAWWISRMVGPFTPDPDYQYLLNGLNILSLRPPNHYDHPGTPLQTLIALVTGVTWLLTLARHGFSSVQADVLTHPQFYMECVNAVLVAALAGAIGFYAWSVRKAGGAVTPALVGLASIFQLYIVYFTFHRIMPEPVLLGTTLLLAGLVAQNAFAETNTPETKWFAAGIGVLLALCVTAKVTSAPVLLTFFFLRSRQARKIAALACAIAAFVFLIPIIPRFGVMFGNYFHIATHTGDYGTAGAGAPSLGTLWTNLLSLWSPVPEMFVYPAFYAVFLVGHRLLRPRLADRALPANFTRALVLCIAVIAFQLLLVSKQPRPYYLLPAVAFICLGNTLIAAWLFRTARVPPWARAVIVVVLAIPAFLQLQFHARTDAGYAAANAALMHQATQSGCLVVPYYGALDPQFMLFFGNISTGARYNGRLAAAYPDFLAYNTYEKRFQNFTGLLTPDEASHRFAGEKCVALMGISWQDVFGIPATALHRIGHAQGGIDLSVLTPGWDSSARDGR